MTPVPGIRIMTLFSPTRYTQAQLDRACAIAQALNRGQFILLEEPKR